MDIKQLQFLGLLQSEAKVYLALLKLGASLSGKIAKETQLNRVSVYKALDNLSKKGLVSYVIKENIKYFEATDPKVIDDLIQKRKEQLEKISKQVPTLESLYKSTKKKVESNIYEGVKGTKAVWENWLKELKKGDEWIILGAPKSAELLGGYFEDFNKRRAKKGIRMKIIYNKDAKQLINVRKKQPLTEVKVMPKEYITPASIEIIKDKVAIVLYEPEKILFVLHSNEIKKSFEHYFNMLWEIAESVT